ncbi:MAG: hypothetical protein IT208_11325 [Chthonomonadales bacterium]|nr:hypothetical protein [Chthonomonadales bacterium]
MRTLMLVIMVVTISTLVCGTALGTSEVSPAATLISPTASSQYNGVPYQPVHVHFGSFHYYSLVGGLPSTTCYLDYADA